MSNPFAVSDEHFEGFIDAASFALRNAISDARPRPEQAMPALLFYGVQTKDGKLAIDTTSVDPGPGGINLKPQMKAGELAGVRAHGVQIARDASAPITVAGLGVFMDMMSAATNKAEKEYVLTLNAATACGRFRALMADPVFSPSGFRINGFKPFVPVPDDVDVRPVRRLLAAYFEGFGEGALVRGYRA